MLKLTGQQQPCSVPRSKLEDGRHSVLSGGAWQSQVTPGAQESHGDSLRVRAGEGHISL